MKKDVQALRKTSATALEFQSSAEFAGASIQRKWLVDSVLLDNNVTVIGGPMKAYKTMLAVDLAISLAAQKPFLDTFNVSRKCRVAFLSGESDSAELLNRAERVSNAKGVDLRELNHRLLWHNGLPNLADEKSLSGLSAAFRSLNIEVCIIDPFYLAFNGSAQSFKPENCFEMGQVVCQLCQACLIAGVTPILVHQVPKTVVKQMKSPHISDLAYAGIADYARQWIMLRHENPFEPFTGRASLQMMIGGNAGQSGNYQLMINEGILDRSLKSRIWAPQVRCCTSSQCSIEGGGKRKTNSRKSFLSAAS